MKIDPNKLPRHAFFDTSSISDVVRPDDRWDDERRLNNAILARAIYQTIVDDGGTIFSSSVVLAEIFRGGAFESPKMKGMFFAPFDNECARILGEVFPSNVRAIRGTLSDGTPEKAPAVKFDTLIISTALRVARRFPFISADKNQLDRASRVGLEARYPDEFAADQTEMFPVEVVTKGSDDK